MNMQRITPFLWFDYQAKEAAEFYTGIFAKSRIISCTLCGEAAAEASGRPLGSVLTVEFELDGLQFVALNGGPIFKFSPAVSFAVYCDTQEEVDYLWDKLLEGGEAQECGWLTDKYGLSWQITPRILPEMLKDPDHEKAERAMRAMLTMVKLEIAPLQAAYDAE